MSKVKSHDTLVSLCLPSLNRGMGWVMLFSCCGSNAASPVTAQSLLRSDFPPKYVFFHHCQNMFSRGLFSKWAQLKCLFEIGLLAIGPQFGGAIDDAARMFSLLETIVLLLGGITNICYNCSDRNVESGIGDKIALYWERNEPGVDASLTYRQLLERVCQLANYMKDIGVRKGDAVVIYLPMLMELPIAMLACARIGVVPSVVFAGFSAESLAQRIVDRKPKVVLTYNAVMRGSKIIYLKDIVDKALTESMGNGISIDACDTEPDVFCFECTNIAFVSLIRLCSFGIKIMVGITRIEL